ncbi:phosphoglycerate dehydrogenase [Fusibacter sp. 3D3]|uniref:phosphoglycerate dehydrogenase n=1 Tax=Fusibacter sp. 3D3 TaxID=1048380 RepID=UPI000852C3E5|nr:phosphoglycerate dehydrogenase [Fusibacter sp. 3D3]GAU78078.1 D-3-phosphoglycerate dehydrogenase [Fusibacter sp. 3D3]
MKILVTENIADEGIAFLKAQNMDVTVNYTLTREALLSSISEYDALIVRSVTKVNEELYAHAKNLKVVGRAGNGVDNIELAGATERGIIVVNTPDANTVSAAEHTIALMLSMARNIPRANQHIKSKQWDRTLFRGVELKGKTLGIIGLGRIGTMVATRMQAFGMAVVAYDPYIRSDKFEKLGVEKMEQLSDLLVKSDFISVHTPKTKETIGIINAESFKLVKRGVRVVNCARGGIIDEAALYDALTQGIVAGAAIDVLKDEPHPISPLLDLESTVITPHLGADTFEAQKNVGESVAIEVFEALKGKLVANAVNLPTLSQQELEHMKPYLTLLERMGKIYHQIHHDAVERIVFTYKGDFTHRNTDPFVLAFIKGLYETVLDTPVTYVNAKLIAENRGVTVSESRVSTTDDFNSSIKIEIHSKNQTFEMEGALFGKNDPRIVSINSYPMDITPKGNMLMIENNDSPGMIGTIGLLLGQNNINISTMNVSLSKTHKPALMLLTIDLPVQDDVLRQIQNQKGILKAWALKI